MDILNWSHPAPAERASGVRHSSTSVDAAPPSPQEVRVEWGRNLLGREGESFQVVSRSFFDYSILYTLRYGGRGRGDIKGFRNPKKAFKVLLYNADTKAAAAATHCDRDSTSASPSYAPKRSPSFFRMACGKLFQIFMKNNQPFAATPLGRRPHFTKIFPCRTRQQGERYSPLPLHCQSEGSVGRV